MSELKEKIYHIKYNMVLIDEATVAAKSRSEAIRIMYEEILREPIREGATLEEYGFEMRIASTKEEEKEDDDV